MRCRFKTAIIKYLEGISVIIQYNLDADECGKLLEPDHAVTIPPGLEGDFTQKTKY